MQNRSLLHTPRCKNRVLPAILFILFCGAFASLLQAQPIAVTYDYNPLTCNGCGTIYVSATGGQPPYTYLWSTGNTTTVNTVCTAGVYTVTVVDEQGVTAVQQIFMPPADVTYANLYSSNNAPCNNDSTLTTGCDRVCPGAVVTYSAEIWGSAGGNPGAATWSVSGASSWQMISNNSIQIVWGSSGSGTVNVYSNSQCGGEASQCVTIVAAPEAQFSSVPIADAGGNIQICKGQSIYFANESLAADLFEWDFGDLSATEYGANAQHQYHNPGNYTVRLIARSSCLCADTTYSTVTVLDAEALSLDCVGTVCAGEEVTYTASGSSCSSYIWNVSSNGAVTDGGGAGQNYITVQWNSGSSGTISLAPQNCAQFACPEPTIVKIPVLDDNAEIKGKANVCPGTTETYTIEPFGGANFTWHLLSGGIIEEGQGTHTVTVKWNDYGVGNIYPLWVEYDNCYLGCSGRDTLSVRILAPFAINGPVEKCASGSGNFSAFRTPGGPLSVNWSLKDPTGAAIWNGSGANATISFPALPGYYRINATPSAANQTCRENAEWAVRVAPLPPAPDGIDGPLVICPGNAVTYAAVNPDPAYSLEWKLTGAAPAVQKGDPINVTWSNSTPRYLSLSHISKDGLNCASDTVRISPTTLSAFSIQGPANACEGVTATYTVPPYNDGMDIQWQVIPADAGVVTTGQGSVTVKVYWTKPGNHTVRAVICSVVGNYPVSIFANPKPTATLSGTGVCPGHTLSVQTDASYTGYDWATAEGVALATNTPRHRFRQAIMYSK